MHFIKLLALFFLLPYAAQADEPVVPLEFTGSYEFAFSSIPFGTLNVTLNQSDHSYEAVSDIAMTGIAKMFVQHESRTTASGSGTHFRYPESTYESSYSTRKKPKYVKMVAKNGVWISEDVRPPDNRAVRPAVSAKDKEGAVDPLFLALSIRAELARCLKASCTSFTQTYYDGRRLTRVDVAIAKERTIRIGGDKYPAYELTARRAPLAGYTEKELKKIGKKDPALTLYFSHDARLIPLLLEVRLSFGTATATLRM